ncbi:SMP-30/gluconolactonase/LRE family protein [uncultured Lacinutrix sp.]|uniref:SMP-30/gluconolactonase/LRE family protein n=1 Tax=uncultured Lacinutrix sp. TaxID=574032 RepID=UPI0026331A96|nr:SMP-30/gluconolactonase/LRE family protein [uncultured Lacinutrix sp.]
MNLKKRFTPFKYRVFNVLLLLLFMPQTIMLSCKTEKQLQDDKVVIVENKTPILEYEIKSSLGEGAFWNHKTKELYWIDIEDKKIHIYNPKTKKNKSFSTPSRVGTVVPYNETEAVIALEDGIYKINTDLGDFSLLANVEANMIENRFNDGKCDPSGNLWVGSMHLEQTKPNASLYKINEEGEVLKMLGNITISNGIVWTSSGEIMYYIDTPTGNIRAFDFDVKTNTIKNERIVIKVPVSLGYPDGMTIDEDDMLWVGLWNGNAVARFNPITGQLISKIEIPAHNVTSCAFGGDNLETLYVTTASVDMTEEEKKQYPLSGSVFSVNPGVKGVKSSFFGNQNNLK